MQIAPFSIHVPDAVLTDLQERLARTRWAPDFANEKWAFGTEAGYLRSLIRDIGVSTGAEASRRPVRRRTLSSASPLAYSIVRYSRPSGSRPKS